MTTQLYLAQLGATMQTARDFIIENVEEPRIIYDICKFFGVNNDMIAEVLQSDFPGLTGNDVSNFFTSNGFNGSELGFNTVDETDDPDVVNDVVEDGTYTGSYSGDQSGILSFTIDDEDVIGTWYSPAWDETGFVSGSVNNNTGYILVSSSDEDGVPITFTGMVANDDATGTWSMPTYGDGTFTADLV